MASYKHLRRHVLKQLRQFSTASRTVILRQPSTRRKTRPCPCIKITFWPGSYAGLGLDGAVAHFLGDLFPSATTIRNAYNGSVGILGNDIGYDGSPIDASRWLIGPQVIRALPSGLGDPSSFQGAIIDGVWVDFG